MMNLAFDGALSGLLNQFSVPMFALDRLTPKDEFRFVCINRALEIAGKKSSSECLGKSVHQLLPKAEADVVRSSYLECAETRNDQRFRAPFTTAGRAEIWDTTLQHVALTDGGDRIVGTCIHLSNGVDPIVKHPVLDDIQYFSSMADLQLRNLISTFEIFRDKDLFSIRNEQHIDKLTGMCRTVQRAVEDIKKVVRTTSTTKPLSEAALRRLEKNRTKTRGNNAGSDTIEALFSDVTEDVRRFN